MNVTGDNLQGVFANLAQLEYDLNNSSVRVSGSVSGLNSTTSVTTGSTNAVDTFAINGVSIGTRVVPTSGPLAGKQIIGFAPGTKVSQVVTQINSQSAQTGVTASIDQTGTLILQNTSTTAKPIVVTGVDQVIQDANGLDVTGGTGVPVSSGGNSTHDLGLSSQMDNAIGSVDVTALDSSLDSVQALRAQLGAKTNRVSEGQTRLSSLGITLTQLDSTIEDVDMAKAISDLASKQTAFQAALGVAAKTLPPSLLDFLK